MFLISTTLLIKETKCIYFLPSPSTSLFPLGDTEEYWFLFIHLINTTSIEMLIWACCSCSCPLLTSVCLWQCSITTANTIITLLSTNLVIHSKWFKISELLWVVVTEVERWRSKKCPDMGGQRWRTWQSKQGEDHCIYLYFFLKWKHCCRGYLAYHMVTCQGNKPELCLHFAYS